MDHSRAMGRQRQRRRWRVRNQVKAAGRRPRLTVFRSHKHIYAQIVDDQSARTLVSASTVDGQVRGDVKYGGNKAAAEVVGRVIAERALAAGVKEVCFDRGHYKYHGRVAAVADAARQAGLQF